MASSVLVSTAEGDEIPVDPIDVVPDDADVVTIDTVQNDLDKLVEETKPPKQVRQRQRQAPVESAPPPLPPKVLSPSPPPKAPADAQVEEPVRRKKQTPPTSKKLLDGQTAFQEALRDTILPSPKHDDDDDDDNPVPPVMPDEEEQEDDEEVEDDSSDDDQGTEPGESGSVDSDEEVREEDDGGEPEQQPDEDEDKKKIRLLEESAALMSDGFMPVQKPTFAMSVDVLEKIVNHQEEQAAEQFGIGLIGFGWVEIIRLIQFANQRFDPASKILGPGKGLKLDGAAEAVAKDIRRYRGPFRFLWKKMQSKKLEEYSPIITMGLVTFDILKKVHVDNVRKEMAAKARDTVHTPMSPAAMRRLQEMMAAQGPEGANPNPSPAREPMPMPIPGEQPVPQSPAPAEPAPVADVQPEQPPMIPVDSIVIPDSDTETAPAPGAGDSDDIVVEVPAGRGRGRGRRNQRR